MKHTVQHCTDRLLAAACRPEVRHSMHYECGLYKSSDARTPVVCARMEHDCTLPLIRLIAIAASIMLAAMALRSLLSFCHRGKCKKHCNE